MSELTWIILILVVWRMVLRPFAEGYRNAGQQKNAELDKNQYTDYEEVN
ncbi:MAG: hypothetical protein ACK4IY_04780 [Chitinophagales bacterium]